MIERRGLMQFVPPNFSADATALVIDAEKYLSPLRELMPAAKIALLTSAQSHKAAELCRRLKVDLMEGDYLRGALPSEPKVFDVIIAEDCLSYSLDTYITLLELNHLLKDSGFLLTQFFNVRFIGVLESLRRGQFPTQEKKFWAKWDVVKLLDGAVYREVHFLPGEQIKNSAADAWLNFGFENFSDDLLTKIWLVQACKSTAEVAALKEFYTEDVRAELSRLIHRIEYDIDVEENISRLKNLCQRENIFADYLNDFVAQVTTHEEVRKILMNIDEV